MTPTAALDAIEEALQFYADRFKNARGSQIKATVALSKIDELRTALQNAPQVVTVDKLWDDFEGWNCAENTDPFEFISEKYPHGLIITAAPKGEPS